MAGVPLSSRSSVTVCEITPRYRYGTYAGLHYPWSERMALGEARGRAPGNEDQVGAHKALRPFVGASRSSPVPDNRGGSLPLKLLNTL